ncbi:MAG TPA: FAD-dependent oxidoreductase [Microvirga sp.]|jgi:salicylate hydroxylase|nr:FAD-dependent oxidoreductase [Microvirga sp.]
MSGLSIAIVGAGIGGLTAALSLARRGHTVTVIERRSGFAEIGAGLQLSPNASRILIDLGLGAALRRVVTEPRRVLMRSIATGAVIGEAAQGPHMRERFGAPAWVLRRADLQTILLDAVRSHASIRLVIGRSVEGCETHERGVTVAMLRANGSPETASFDLAVGADGIWSKLRAAAGIEVKPRYCGYVAWRATVARQQVPPEIAENETGLWLSRAGHVVHYPVAAGRQINIVAVHRRADPVEGWSVRGYPEELQARFAGTAPLFMGLLRSPHDWQLWSLFDLPARQMAVGRIALLGDAGHPVLPFLAQGAALAIEDAAVLTGMLEGAADVPAALELYARHRLRRVRRVQRAARFNGLVYHAGPLVAFARDRIIGRLGAAGMTDRYAWLYGYRPSLAPARGSR